MINKKGISPLISTILLVALAVAIGTSIVSYSGKYFESQSLNKNLECRDYGVAFFELDKSKNTCSGFKSQLLLKFWGDKNKPLSEKECYASVASGTSHICNAKPVFIDKTWTIADAAQN